MIFSIKKQNYSNWIQPIVCVTIVFCYIFSFYIIGPINSSMMVAAMVSPYFLIKNRLKELYWWFNQKYFLGIFLFIIFLISLSLVFSIFHGTYDTTYLFMVIPEIIHICLGIIIIAFLQSKYRLSLQTIIKYVIFAYISQSTIEIIASVTPPFVQILKIFNRAEYDGNIEGVRGLALSSATGWSLGLTFGLIFILYINTVLIKRINLKTLGGFVLLVMGTFFAGRTGLLGILLGGFYYICINPVRKTLTLFSTVIISVFLVCILTYVIFPSYVDYAVSYLLPFALEPIFNLIDGKGFSSRSTDILITMWDHPLTDKELFIGSGHFTNSDGSYYLHTDVGILRNIFYWGVLGYVFIIAYQLYLSYPIIKNKTLKGIGITMLIYLFICEFKAITFGLNKMTLSIIFFLSVYSIKSMETKKFI